MPNARAQGDQPPSIADAARRAREQKAAAAKPTAVITNDTLKPAPSEAQPQASGDASAKAAANSTAAGADAATAAATAAPPSPSGPTEKEVAAKKARITALKQQYADKKNEVDLQKRALALANDDYYSRPDFSKDPDGKAKLDAMQSDLTQKQDELADLKAKLAAEGANADDKPETTKPQ